MNRLAALIESLSHADVLLIKKDLEAGNIQSLIDRRIASLETVKSCPTCGSDLTRAEQKFSLEFGPVGLRQRAYFDELDCLHYFLEKKRAADGGVQLMPPGAQGAASTKGETFDD